MSVIFGMSTSAGSSGNTSRIIGPLLRWFDPGISDETVGAIQLAVRKLAHFTEYGILALLLWRARRQPFRGDRRPWQWPQAATAFAIAAAFAASDEWHQSFVPTREACVRDALIDVGGAAAALCALWWLGRRLRKW